MEAWLSELRSSMITLQKETISVMLSVEKQQQQITLQKLLMIVDAERSYRRHVLSILEELHAELILAKVIVPSGDVTQRVHNKNKDYDYFIGKIKVIHPFDVQANGELSLNVDEYVIVRQVPLCCYVWY
ncbi:hypothetical protein HanRHA438_Chr15g0707521 [Helianthus annuus]|uniref:Uncharacterized protein n=1 Tax=Helianthus annuus TaxID=4232 RepID=A0A9K3H377_HELAN|nr:hypothetical protein HanXRQr2_Chr15g0695051 [Helianthus annuus]KAJ0451343.1 hypothetical protein HanHA300_Chr15g0566461 [Helianthus annuus]KAJ0455835.1 hypothetical protein HanIR_Chr15g0755591 [Helianthus annuus]KAJ0473217.1 hypothetical protein HanHA89_Chr15g0615821 [Helianthus annuus]KAJ0648807.1 hypothetical protein HanLR1_Chr15g0577041 [Helianthus annuus]